jgi:hypothetical protein
VLDRLLGRPTSNFEKATQPFLKFCPGVWEIIADNLNKRSGVWAAFHLWTLKSEQSGLWMRTRDGKRFVVRANEKLTTFLEFQAAIAATANVEETTWQTPEPWAS